MSEDGSQKVLESIDRERVWLAQTPQVFRREVLLEALRKAKKQSFVGTDESSLVELAGQSVSLVEGSSLNIKLTAPDDLTLLEACFMSHES